MLAVVQLTLHKSTADAKTPSESKVLNKGISLKNLSQAESYVVELVDLAEVSVLLPLRPDTDTLITEILQRL